MVIPGDPKSDKAMPKLFISYRREDSAYPAHSICERLKSHFGKDSVFIDVDTIPYGVDFRKHLNEAVAKCDVLLAVIGSKWPDSKQEDGSRRLDDPNGPSSGRLRVMRGGAWGESALSLRSANRFEWLPESRLSAFGIRPARTCP